MSEELNQQLPLERWQALSIRLTSFPGLSASKSVAAEAWFEDVVGSPADQVTRRKNGETVAAADTENGQLVLSIDPLRIDFRVNYVEESMIVMADFSTIGSFLRSHERFLPLALNFLQNSELKVNRLAFGAELLIAAKGHSEAYSQLSEYLPDIKIDPNGSFDFTYQINRPRTSQFIPDLRINRLTKWSALKLSRGVVLPSGKAISIPDMDQYYCRLEVDINTTAEHEGFIAPDELPKLFQELVDLGKEIAENGDIP
jgi:hypothetical protein